jgi:hypothetical protein
MKPQTRLSPKRADCENGKWNADCNAMQNGRSEVNQSARPRSAVLRQITATITEPERLIINFKITRKFGFACIGLLFGYFSFTAFITESCICRVASQTKYPSVSSSLLDDFRILKIGTLWPG